MSKEKGFTACGKFYEMGETQTPYIKQLQNIFTEIRENSLKAKLNKKH